MVSRSRYRRSGGHFRNCPCLQSSPSCAIQTKALPVVVGVLLLSGTIFYRSVEDWTLIQALYFSVVTLATVGYGDLTPTTDFSRISGCWSSS